MQPWRNGVELPPRLDVRLQQTGWGDWTRAGGVVANERIWELLQDREQVDLAKVLKQGECFSPSDNRFTLNGQVVRRRGALHHKVLDEVPEDERFERYLPVLDLQVVGSADPKKDMRGQVVDEVPILGWVDAIGLKRKPNDRMHVVRLEGDSMEPLADGAWLVLELSPEVEQGQIGAVSLCQDGAFTVVLKKVYVEGNKRRLRSTNDNYADTVYGPGDIEEFKVVARFVEELPPPRRTRSADPARLKGWLDKRFEAPTPVPDAPDLPPQLDGVSVLELTSKGLIWALRLEPLPGFIDHIEVAGIPVSAEQVRGRVARLAVSPSSEAFALAAGPLTSLLAPFEHKGLPLDRATVFRLDGSGRAVRQLGPQVRSGDRVRLLLPPGIDVPAQAESEWMVGAWAACALTVGLGLPEALGLALVPERVESHWEVAPTAWHRLVDGTRVPVFSPDQSPALRVHGVSAAFTGEFRFTSPAGSQPLPKGGPWSLEISEAGLGPHALEITPAATEVPTERRAFLLRDQAPTHWPAAVTVDPADASDLRDWTVNVTGPPLWPVRAIWQGSRRVERDLKMGPDGRLPLEAIEIDTRALRTEPMGRLVLDFGELGQHVVCHAKQERREDLEEAVQLFLQHASDDLLLLEKLAERLLGTLGWAVAEGVVRRAGLAGDVLTYQPHAVLLVAGDLATETRERATAACKSAGLDLCFVVSPSEWLRFSPSDLFPAPTIDPVSQRMAFLHTFHWKSR